MTRVVPLLAIAIAFLLPAHASNPGEPLDCSDWVFNEPGFGCNTVAPAPCSTPLCGPYANGFGTPDNPGGYRAVDNDGAVYMVKRVNTGEFCVFDNQTLSRLELIRLEPSSEVVVGFVDERCTPVGGSGRQMDLVRPSRSDLPTDLNPASGVLLFDATGGRMLLPLISSCFGNGCTGYGGGTWLAAITGFTTTFEILQTYTPPSGPIAFRVPYMPEGFEHADYFDTYYGALATVGDWSQLQPLQCGYPASPPSVGDYLTAADPLPTPSPGAGYYYVTAVRYQGQVRRDPAVLPACQ